jgi:hypothetical protein
MSTSSDQIADLISGYTDLKDYFEQYREEMQPFMAAVQHPNKVTLEVGAGKAFAHPVDAYLHINNHAMANNIAWNMVVYPGVYTFPYKGYHTCHFRYSKQVTIRSSTNNAADVVFESNSERHHWLIIGDHNCHINIRHISFRDTRELTSDRIVAVNNRNYVDNDAGGVVHGVLVRYGSTLNITQCQFNHLWHTIALHDSSQAYIDRCIGTNVTDGPISWRNGFVRMLRCQWTGVGDPDDDLRHGVGSRMRHGSVLHANGTVIDNFSIGLESYWNSDMHFNRFQQWGGSDGRTPINIVNGHVENCRNGVRVVHNSGGHFTNLTIANSLAIAFATSYGSNAFAHSGVTIDGADYGFYCRHNASIVANNAVVSNCLSYGFHAAYFGEIHANSTTANVSGNGTDYSPETSHTLGNYSGQIYFS